jgi:hypothetical protein
VVADTWDTHSREDVVEWTVLSATRRSRDLAGHTSGRGGRARGAVLTVCLVVWASKPTSLRMTGFEEFEPQNSAAAVPEGFRVELGFGVELWNQSHVLVGRDFLVAPIHPPLVTSLVLHDESSTYLILEKCNKPCDSSIHKYIITYSPVRLES